MNEGTFDATVRTFVRETEAGVKCACHEEHRGTGACRLEAAIFSQFLPRFLPWAAAIHIHSLLPTKAELRIDTLEDVELRVLLRPCGADVLSGEDSERVDNVSAAAFADLHSLLMRHSPAYGKWYLTTAFTRALAARSADDAISNDDGGH